MTTLYAIAAACIQAGIIAGYVAGYMHGRRIGWRMGRAEESYPVFIAEIGGGSKGR